MSSQESAMRSPSAADLTPAGRPSLGLALWRVGGQGVSAMEIAAAAGIARVQIDLGGPGRGPFLGDDAALDAHRTAALRLGLTISAVAVNRLNDIGLTAHAGSEAAALAGRCVAQAAKAARRLGARYLIVPGFRESEVRTLEDFARTVDFLRFGVDLAAPDLGIAYETGLDADLALKILRAADLPGLTLQFDTANPSLCGHCAASMWPALMAAAAPEVHVKDWPTRPGEDVQLGDGQAALKRTFAAFASHGWPSALILEGDYVNNAATRIRCDLACVEDLIAKHLSA
jgi:sugar phosphate isomerase/epimerase